MIALPEMDATTVLSLCISSLVVFISYKKIFHARISSDEPHFFTGLLPFVGVALQFGADPNAFLRRCQAACKSPVFTLYMMGKRMTFILDVHSFPQIMRKSRELSFAPVVEDILSQVFGVDRNKVGIKIVTAGVDVLRLF